MSNTDPAFVAISLLALLLHFVANLGLVESFVAAFAIAGVVVVVSRRAGDLVASELEEADSEPDGPVAVRDAHEAYVDGVIDEAELESRLERALDPDVRAIRRRFEPVDDVGPETCRRLADSFGTVASIERADASELEEVDGIGPERAASIANADVETATTD
jgi:hypothetical protein